MNFRVSSNIYRSLVFARPTLGLRFQSTDPKQVAESLINRFPGSSVISKTGSALLAASIASYLISKEIYILDGEVFEVIALFGAYAIWYINGKDAMGDYLGERRSNIYKVLKQARDGHKLAVQEKVDHISKMSELVDVTSHLYTMSKEMAEMQSQIYELKQKVGFTTQVKSVLDSWVRHEASVRDQEQKRLISQVLEKVNASLKDPKFQQAVLNQTISDVETITSKA